MADKYPNWFNVTAKDNFEQFLIPLAGVDNLKFLQLGVYTGDASLWLLENVLTGQGCNLTDVDTWQGSNEEAHESIDFDEVFNIYKKKLEKHVNKLLALKEDTVSALIFDLRYSGNQYDFIYVDADHTAAGAFLDAELSWPLLKPGGILAFDDYTWRHTDGVDIHAPKIGIGMFLDRHKGEFEVLVINSQCWIRKHK